MVKLSTGELRPVDHVEDRATESKSIDLGFLWMTDQWNQQLRCPICRQTGMASLSQEADGTLTVHSVSDGFKVVKSRYGPGFHCVGCNVPVVP